MNKRGLEDTIFVWIAVLFILIFFIFIYFGIIFIMFGDKTVFGDGEVVVEGSNDLIVVESYIDFLESEVEFEGSNILVEDLVNLDKEGLEKFMDLGSGFVESLDSRKIWLRVYDFEENVEMSFKDGEYKDYEVKRSVRVGGNSGSWSPSANIKKEVLCNPENSDGFLFFGFSLNKKIALCWENE